jgi:hypothetical protein
METLTPSLGDIVVVPVDPGDNNGARIAPAIITRVWNPDCINVRVVLDGAGTLWRTSCVRVDSLPAANGSNHVWTWPTA